MKVQKYNVGPVGVQALTKTDAREQAITAAAKILERLEGCPNPLPGPPDTEILAICFLPSIQGKWTTQYVFPDRVLRHDSQSEIGVVRKEAVEFAAQHGLSRHTSQRQIEKLTDWAATQLRLSAMDAELFANELTELVLRCEAAYELRGIRLANGTCLSPHQVHDVLCGAPHLDGELLELYQHHVKSRGIK